MKSETRQFAGRIGVLVAASLTALLVVLYMLSGAIYIPGFVKHSDYRLSLEFNEVDNLVTASQVRIAGVRVGEVTETKPIPTGALVEFIIRNPDVYPLHEGLTVQLQEKSAQGEYYLNVIDGKGPEIPAGTKLPRSVGRQSTQLFDLYKTLNTTTQADTRDMIQKLAVSTGSTKDQVAATFTGLGALGREGYTALDAVSSQSKDLESLVADTSTVLDALDTGQGQIAQLVRSANKVTASTAGQRKAIEETFQLLPGVMDSAKAGSDSLAKLSGALAPVAADLRVASPGLSESVKELPKATDDLRGMLPAMSDTLDRAPATLDRTGKFSDDLSDFFPSARNILRDINPILKYVEPYGPEIAAYIANFNASVGYTDRAGVHYVRAGLFANEEMLQSPVDVPLTTYENPFPKPGTGANPGPFAGPYPRVERESR